MACAEPIKADHPSERSEARQDGQRSSALRVWVRRRGFRIALITLGVIVAGLVGELRAPRVDPASLYETVTDRENDRLGLVNAEMGYALAKAQWVQAMGLDRGVSFEVADDGEATVSGEDESAAALLERALATRPDVLAGLRAVESAQRSRSAARGGHGPTLSASASATESGSALDALSFNWSVGGTVSGGWYEGGQTRASVAVAEAGIDAAAARVEQPRLAVQLGLEQAQLRRALGPRR